MARGTESWKAANHKRPPQNKGKNHKPLPRQHEEIDHQKTFPLALQQKCLNLFRDALSSRGADHDDSHHNDDDDDVALLQEVKGHLYKRDFTTAFGKAEYLRVYALRWSPSRALGYLQILSDIQEVLLEGHSESGTETLKVICLGGGAGAELVAIAGWLHEESEEGSARNLAVQALLLDVAAWDTTVSNLQRAVVSAPVLSKYASAAAKAGNVPLLAEETLETHFQQVDVLDIDDEKSGALYGSADLITLMFTLNELYSTSMPKTQKMLARITDVAQPGTLLLVVDSPGSYSTVTINGAEKKYPMQWLLDHTLLGTQQKRGEEEKPAKWRKLMSDESRWFRLPEGLEYRLELENMRYQIHLYRREDSATDEE